MKIKIMDKEVCVPKKGSEHSAGIDVHAPIYNIIPAGKTLRIPLGIAIEIPIDEVAIMSERSSQGKKGITSVGNIIDADYRGEISIVLQNNSSEDISFEKGERIGQIIVCKLGNNDVLIVNELSETIRGDGGFGSTGK